MDCSSRPDSAVVHQYCTAADHQSSCSLQTKAGGVTGAYNLVPAGALQRKRRFVAARFPVVSEDCRNTTPPSAWHGLEQLA